MLSGCCSGSGPSSRSLGRGSTTELALPSNPPLLTFGSGRVPASVFASAAPAGAASGVAAGISPLVAEDSMPGSLTAGALALAASLPQRLQSDHVVPVTLEGVRALRQSQNGQGAGAAAGPAAVRARQAQAEEGMFVPAPLPDQAQTAQLVEEGGEGGFMCVYFARACAYVCVQRSEARVCNMKRRASLACAGCMIKHDCIA